MRSSFSKFEENGGIHTRFNTYTRPHLENRKQQFPKPENKRLKKTENSFFFEKLFFRDLARLGHI